MLLGFPPNPMSRSTQRQAALRSFSLLEMIVVLAIMLGLSFLALQGCFAVVQASAITTGAQMLGDAMTEGRADAVAQNLTVEVRLYAVLPSSGSTATYSALQLHWIKPDGTTPPVAAPLLLSSWVAMDATAQHSSLIGANTQTATPDASDPRLNSDTRVFHFLPDGSTDLNPSTNWFVTVRPANQTDTSHFPANWACVQVDASTGRVQLYHP